MLFLQVNRKYVRKGVEVKVGEHVAASREQAEEGPAAESTGKASVVGTAANPYAIDLEAIEDKPWRKPGADLSDWFNYGFNEETWQAYCAKQMQLRRMNAMQASIQVVETDRREPAKEENRDQIRTVDASRQEGGHSSSNFPPHRQDRQDASEGRGPGWGAGPPGFMGISDRGRDGDGSMDRQKGDAREGEGAGGLPHANWHGEMGTCPQHPTVCVSSSLFHGMHAIICMCWMSSSWCPLLTTKYSAGGSGPVTPDMMMKDMLARGMPMAEVMHRMVAMGMPANPEMLMMQVCEAAPHFL